MMKKWFQLAAATASGYAFIQWMPVAKLTSVTQVMLALIMDPFHYFIAMVSFFFSFLFYAVLIKFIVEETYLLVKKKKGHWGGAFISCGIAGSFFFLLQAGDWQAVLVLCFSIVYGMISVDLKKRHVMDTHY